MQTSMLFSASTHICIIPSRYSLAYSSGSSIAKAFKAHSEQGVVFNPSSAFCSLAIYFHIFELIPCLEQEKDRYDRNSETWLKFNAFKVRRIDFAFDLETMHQQYITLINRGYSLRKRKYQHLPQANGNLGKGGLCYADLK